MKTLLIILATTLTLIADGQAELKVSTLHPLMTDLAKRVGGSHVAVTGLMKAGEDIHHFEPSSSDMVAIRASDVVLASGKGVELYLPKLQKALDKTTRIVQAGNVVPSIKVTAGSSVFICCPQHAAGSVDPHWWHSISGMKKAADYTAKEFGKADRANADAYRANAAAYRKELDRLSSWAKRELSRVSRSNRTLVTAHAAFGYFCKEFGFQSIPVAGLSAEAVSSKYLAEAVGEITKRKISCVFPENNANKRSLQSLISATGVSTGRTLIADGSASGVTTYESFIRHNVAAIVAALGASS